MLDTKNIMTEIMYHFIFTNGAYYITEIRNQKSFIQRMYREYIDNMITHVHAK